MGVAKQDVVHAATQLERDGRQFYLDAAAKSSNELGRKMLESFAVDELHHIEWIKTVSEGEVPEVEPPSEIYDRLRGIFAGASDDLRKAAAGTSDDADAIRIAIGMEDKSVEAYEGWAADADDPEVRDLCGKLAQVEKLHRQLLENTAEYLDNTGDWFMQEEGWSFDGG